MQIRELLKQSSQQLAALSDSPRLDAEILLAHCLQKNRSYLYTWPEQCLDKQQIATYHALIAQRINSQPIAYLTGYREFWGLKLKVTPATLIPRPDTELLVETALEQLAKMRHRQQAVKILDLGTGSGAIALALASEAPTADITATDYSQSALAVAEENARRHQLNNIRVITSDWFAAIPPTEKFDLIVSNPPYIASDDPHLEQGDVRFEPETALIAGIDGLDAIRQLITQAKTYLVTGGMLILEHGYDQAQVVGHLLRNGGYQSPGCRQDLAGNDRISYGHYCH